MLKKYKPFIKSGAMNTLAFRGMIITWLIVTSFQVLGVVFLWFAIYKNSPNGFDSVIKGFTFKEMIVYTVFMNIFGFVSLGGDTLYIMDEDIKKGTIDLAFTKPISYRLRLLFENLGNFFMLNFMLGIPLFTIAYIVFVCIGYITISNVGVFIVSIFLFLLAQILANIVNDTISYLAGVCCFYTTSSWGITQMKDIIVRFLSGGLLPLAFFPGWAGAVVQYLPFASISYYPVLILIGKSTLWMSIHYVGFALVWVIVLGGCGKILFMHASKKITVMGG